MADQVVDGYEVQAQSLTEVVTYSLHLAVQKLSALCSVNLSDTFEVVKYQLKQVIEHHDSPNLDHIKRVISSEDGKHFGVSEGLTT